MNWVSELTASAMVAVFLLGLWALRLRSRRQLRDEAAYLESVEENRHEALTLHPVIDPDICIGSGSCLKACPEGDILGLVNGATKLVDASKCVGHGRCAAECPVSAIKLVFGSSQRGVDLPELNTHFESSRRGVHIVGELGGMGLIRNAFRQSVQVSEYLGKTVTRSRKGRVDVAIVGAGPAGLGTAAGCREAGLSFRVLEAESLGGSVANYPRQKVVMSEPFFVPGFGKVSQTLISKDELIGLFDRLTRKLSIDVATGQRVTTIEGEDGDFRIPTAQGLVKAQKVVLAIGRRGTPNRLGVRGENLPKVSHRLIDPQQYDRCKMIVVGGGDSALEAACRLVEETEADVLLCHRGPHFNRAGEVNRRKLKALGNKVHVAMNTTLHEIKSKEVVLNTSKGRVRLANDYVLVCSGGKLPTEFLRSADIRIKSYFGTAPSEEKPSVARAPRGIANEDSLIGRYSLSRNGLKVGSYLLASLLIVGLWFFGWKYYRLPLAERSHSPLHSLLRPSGPMGHGIGIVATAAMLTNFLYSLRKRWRRLKRSGQIRSWLSAHVFVGFMAPPLIAFHAAFQSKNVLASATAGALGMVVLTGIIGRYLYGLVPTKDGRAVDLKDLSARLDRLTHRLAPALDEGHPTSIHVRTLVTEMRTGEHAPSFARFLLLRPFITLATAIKMFRARKAFAHPAKYREFVSQYRRAWRLQGTVAFYKGLRRTMGAWRLLHAVLAISMAVLIVGHIGVSLYLGYFWIFR